MAAGHAHARWGAEPSGVSLVGITASPGADGVVGHNAGIVTAEDVDWLVAHLRVVVAASPAVWAGQGVTLLQLSALHLISALAPVTVTGLMQSLGTKAAATSTMVDRLVRAGLVQHAGPAGPSARPADPDRRGRTDSWRHRPEYRQTPAGGAQGDKLADPPPLDRYTHRHHTTLRRVARDDTVALRRPLRHNRCH